MFKKNFLILCMASLGTVGLYAQSELVVDLPAPDDSGWIRLFDGNNLDDFFTYYSNYQYGDFPDGTFSNPAGDTIRASGNPTGHVMHKQIFSHYMLRFQMHYPNNNQGNAGVLIHVLDEDPLLFGSFPRSIEAQGDPAQGMGQVWCISDVWVDVRARGSNPPIYDPQADFITYGAANTNSRVIAGIEGWAKPTLTQQMNQAWSQYELEVHGSDSIMHRVHGTEVIKYYDPRVSSGGNPNNVQKRLSFGKLAWQSEGVPVMYRNIMIKLFPEDPLYEELYAVPGCMDSTYEEYNPDATVDDGSCQTVTLFPTAKGVVPDFYVKDNRLYLASESSREYQVFIYDLNGKEVYRQSVSPGRHQSISLRDMIPGLYTLRISNPEINESKRFLIP